MKAKELRKMLKSVPGTTEVQVWVCIGAGSPLYKVACIDRVGTGVNAPVMIYAWLPSVDPREVAR